MNEYTVCYLVDHNFSKPAILMKQTESTGKLNGVGGKIEDGEYPKECAIKEIREETGYVVKDIDLIGILECADDCKTENGAQCKLYFYTADITGLEKKEPHENNIQVTWWSIDALLDDMMQDPEHHVGNGDGYSFLLTLSNMIKKQETCRELYIYGIDPEIYSYDRYDIVTLIRKAKKSLAEGYGLYTVKVELSKNLSCKGYLIDNTGMIVRRNKIKPQ